MSTFSKWDPVAREYNPLKAGSIDGTDTLPHDHGIVRAMQAEYKPNKLIVGDPKATVFVGHLNPETTESTIKKVFSRSGEIKRLRLVRDVVTGFSKGYAFVEYYDKYDALKAQRDFNKITIDEKEVFVDGECERLLPGWIPRRLGGGLSGKKESGQLRFGGKERPFKKPILAFKCQDRRDSRLGVFQDKDQRNIYGDRNYPRDRHVDKYGYKHKENDRSSYRRSDERYHNK